MQQSFLTVKTWHEQLKVPSDEASFLIRYSVRTRTPYTPNPKVRNVP